MAKLAADRAADKAADKAANRAADRAGDKLTEKIDRTVDDKTNKQPASALSETDEKQKRGYLNDDYMFFHLCDIGKREYEYHYHDFDKIYIPIKGKVTYRIEGRGYRLDPYDIVLVKAGLMHRPEVVGTGTYERMIIYINPRFLLSCSDELGRRTGSNEVVRKEDVNDRENDQDDNRDGGQCDTPYLGSCFDKAAEGSSYVFRIPAVIKSRLWHSIRSFENAKKECGTESFASYLYERVHFIEMMIELNRVVSGGEAEYVSPEEGGRASEILDYINAHLTESLDIEKLASLFFMNRYYLMHIFRSETGGTLGRYISSKRLIMARNMIRMGATATQACFECGFRDYSAFYRAYKKAYGASPGTAIQSRDDILKE